ncbi:Helix-turn-helix domain containing protein [uncultured Caudovirales phage]|uniref:Helix-turn-helix domain containing protein n=1 Tax=uncultured Caudovirales phage TaxID=2100421 RepID=A0A6J5RJJ1_9CAUD|nr:Helix-turn-helix domain containing protein [uncultured Caudovirales phage]
MLVSMREAAKIMGVSRQRIHQLLRAGRIPGAQKMDNGGGGLWVIPRGSIRPKKEST